MILGLVIIGAAATLLWQVHRARQQARWREDTEARMAAMQERRAQSNGHPHSGQVQHLGRHL